MSSLAIHQNLSVVIPRVLSNINALEIGHFFEYYDFGKVMGVDLFPRNRRFNKAVLYFEYWKQNEMVKTFYEKIMAGRETRVMYDEPNYWNLYLNHERKVLHVDVNESIKKVKTNESGARILAVIGVVKTNKNGAKLLTMIRSGKNGGGIRYIYRELEEGEILE